MRIESYLVAEMLQRMEQLSAAVRGHTVEVVTALGKDEHPAALGASAELHRALDALVSATRMLQDHVAANDGLGAVAESFGELMLRARGLVLLTQLDLLREALVEPAAHARAHTWYAGRFQGITDVVALVREQLDQIHAVWTPHRHNGPRPPGMTEQDRTSLYRTSIRVAHRALCELRDDLDLGRFLDAGAAAADLPEVQRACKRIDAVLGMQIELEPGRQPPRKPRRLHNVNGAVECP